MFSFLFATTFSRSFRIDSRRGCECTPGIVNLQCPVKLFGLHGFACMPQGMAAESLAKSGIHGLTP